MPGTGGYRGELNTVSFLSEFTDKEVKGNETITAYSATKHVSWMHFNSMRSLNMGMVSV